VTRLLLVAPTVDGTDVGESWVAYQWAQLLSERVETTLLTYRKRDRPSSRPQLPRTRVVEWVEAPLVGRSERFNSLLKPAYLPFYHQARRWIRQARSRGEVFDVAFQPLPVAMRYPSPLAGSGIPYVLGPVGGSLSSPPGFDTEDTAPWYVGLRQLDAARLRHDPWLRRTYTRASCVLAIAPYAAEALESVDVKRLELMSETGLTAMPEGVVKEPGTPVRLLFVGRLIRTKGVRDAIRALALVRDLPFVFDVVGDGRDRSECERLAETLGIVDKVEFHGTKSRSEVDAFYRASDVFLFPSYREPGGNVVFEAMGHGLAMIVCDRGGPSHVVDPTCGIRVPAHDPQQYPRELADAVRALVTDPGRVSALGRGAREKVARAGLWQHRVDRVEEIFRELR
jgi:glycosyltransferase involved in cell wall biosynthesis